MTTIYLSANDQDLVATIKPKVASGCQNSVALHVDFSSEWDGYAKSGVFFTAKDDTVFEKVMTEGECVVPSEVITDSGILFIGVRGVDAENNKVKTTSLVKYKIVDGSPECEDTSIKPEPTPDVYEQLLTAYGKTDAAIQKEASARKAADAEEASARKAADAEEASARKAADAEEASARKAADEKEKSERQTADSKEATERKIEIAVERARIDSIIASKGSLEYEEYVINESNPEVKIITNKINAAIVVTGTIIQGTTTIYLIPRGIGLEPLETVTRLYGSPDTDLVCVRLKENNRIFLDNMSEKDATGTFYFGYALKDVIIPELNDLRIGADGITYDSAGSAVRGQYTALKEDLAQVIPRIDSFPITNIDVVKQNPTRNLVNLNDCVSGVIGTNGTITENADYLTTGYIEVTNQRYTRKSTYGRIYQFDADKNYLRTSSVNLLSLTPNTDVKYIRYSFSVANKDEEMFLSGNMPYAYIPFNNVIPTENLDLPNRVDDVFANHYLSTNRCNPVNITSGNLSTSVGSVGDNSTTFVSDFCDILTDNHDMVVSFGVGSTAVNVPKYCFYDKYKRYISGENSTERKENIAVPYNAKYIRVGGAGNGAGVFVNVGKDNFTKVDFVCDYYDKDALYFMSKSFNANSFRRNQWFGKTWCAFGDSITAMSNNVTYGWTNYADNEFSMNPCIVRGVGGTKFAWGYGGGCVVLIDANGNYGERNESYTKDTFPLSQIPSGYTITRGCLASWDRITKSFPESIKDTIDLVFVFGGANDDGNNTEPQFVKNSTIDTEWVSSSYYSIYGGDYNIETMMGGMASCLMKLQAWMPNATIVYGVPFLCGRGEEDMTSIVTDLNPAMWSQSRLLESVAKRCGFPVIDVYSESGVNGWNRLEYVADIIHPTRKGMMMIGKALCNGLVRIYPRIDVL